MKQKREFNKKNKIFISYSQQNLHFHNSKLFLHPKWYLTIMLVNFYFFPHDITLTASFVGESVISHNSGRILILLKWCNSLKASCWSTRQQELVTRSYSHANRLMARRYKYVYMLLPICAQFRYANGDSPYAKFPAFLPVRIRGVPVCIWGSVSDGSAIFP